MHRWIHRAAATGMATAGMLILGTGLATAETQPDVAAPHTPDDPSSEPALDKDFTTNPLSDSGERAGAHVPMPMPPESDVDRDRISPQLQPRSVHPPAHAGDTSDGAVDQAAGTVQQHPIHVQD